MEKNRKLFNNVLISTSILGFWAHGFGFANLNPSHDSLTVLYRGWGSVEHEISLGRFLTPVYSYLTGTNISMPWSIGILCLLEIGISVFLICVMLDLNQKKQVVIVAGIMTVNITTVGLMATYIPWAALQCFAMFTSVAAAYFWNEFIKNKAFLYIILGVSSLFVSLGSYQSYVATFVVVVLLISIHHLLNGKSAASIIKDGCIAIVVLILAGIVYIVALKCIAAITGFAISEGSYNSLSNLTQNTEPILRRIYMCVYMVVERVLVKNTHIYSNVVVGLANCILWVSCLLPVLAFTGKTCAGWQEKVLLFVLLGALIPASNCIRLLNTEVHDLMVYAIWLLYILPVLLYNDVKCSSHHMEIFLQTASVVVLFLFMFANIQMANQVYVKKDVENKAALSIMTAITAKIEALDGYIEGETPVLFLGYPEDVVQSVQGTEMIQRITGASSNFPITYEESCASYFRNVLLKDIPVIMDDDGSFERLNESIIGKMPTYPGKGSIAMIDGTVVVKCE